MSEPNGRLRVSADLVVKVVAWVAAVALAYGAVNTRVAVLEERYERMQIDLAEIKADLKTLLLKVR